MRTFAFGGIKVTEPILTLPTRKRKKDVIKKNPTMMGEIK